MIGQEALERDIESVLLAERRIQAGVAVLAERISADYRDRNLVLVGVLKGAVIFMADLSRHLTVPHEFDFVAASSYGSATETSGVVRLLKDLDRDIAGQHVLLVDGRSTSSPPVGELRT